MEDEIIIGARRVTGAKKESLNIERIYSLENFQNLILNHQNCKIEDLVKKVQVSETHQRFNIWRILLKIMPNDNQENMLKSLNEQREFYNKESQRLMPLKKEITPTRTSNNPLQQRQQNNPWNNFFEDNDLKHMIKIDVERTYQDMEIFQKVQIKDILQNILFVWSKQNSTISYKQGMNEIVALLTFIYFTECPENNKAENREEQTYAQFINEKDAEADIYHLFKKILEQGHLEMFSNQKNIPPILQHYKSSNLEDVNTFKQKNLSVVLLRCKKVFDYLGITDKDLAAKFKIFSIEPQIFLLRWIRCLFAREFHILDCLKLQDAIFYDYYINSEDNPFVLIDCICVSMITFLKIQLMEMNDETQILQRLMKYPPIESLCPLITQSFLIRSNLVQIENDMKNQEQEKKIQKQNQPKKEIILFNNSLDKPTQIYNKKKKQYQEEENSQKSNRTTDQVSNQDSPKKKTQQETKISEQIVTPQNKQEIQDEREKEIKQVNQSENNYEDKQEDNIKPKNPITISYQENRLSDEIESPRSLFQQLEKKLKQSKQKLQNFGYFYNSRQQEVVDDLQHCLELIYIIKKNDKQIYNKQENH